jgi:hypothetical protein
LCEGFNEGCQLKLKEKTMKVLKRNNEVIGDYTTIHESKDIHIELEDGVFIHISESHDGYYELLKSDFNKTSRLLVAPQSGNVILIK